MKKLILFNVLLFISLLTFQQMNVSLYNFIHFNPAQSLFTRTDFAMIAGILLLMLVLIIYFVIKVINKTSDDNQKKIMSYEIYVALIVGITISMYMVVSVFFPSISSITTLDYYNKPYLKFVFVFFIELILLVYLIIKVWKLNGKIDQLYLHYYWFIPLPYFITGIFIMVVEGMILEVANESIEFRVSLNQFNNYLFILLGVILITSVIRKVLQLKENWMYKILLSSYVLIITVLISMYWIDTIQWK